MAVTVEQIIAQREKIKAKKQALYDLETSIGTITVRPPGGTLIAEAWEMTNSFEGNAHIVYESVVTPDLKSKELQEAFGAFDPTEIVTAIFEPGEINKIAGKLLELSGFKGKIASKIHENTKN